MADTSIQDFRPDQEIFRQATLAALQKQVGEDEVRSFVEKLSGPSVPAPIGATGGVNIAVWGKCTCDPDGQPWKFNRTVWGGPAYFGSAVGFLYTAYTDWSAFFNNVTSVHCQGIASGGGILQINWFNKNGTPVGQFNGAAGGIGLLQAGGSGGWEKA